MSNKRLGLVIVGAALLIIGGPVWIYTNAAATTCSSALVSAVAATTCTEYTAVHEIGLVAAVIGIVLLVVGIIRREA